MKRSWMIDLNVGTQKVNCVDGMIGRLKVIDFWSYLLYCNWSYFRWYLCIVEYIVSVKKKWKMIVCENFSFFIVVTVLITHKWRMYKLLKYFKLKDIL